MYEYQYYSKKLNKTFDKVEDLKKAEDEFDAKEKQAQEEKLQKENERKDDSAQVEAKYKYYIEAQKAADISYKEYIEAKQNFIKKYKGFHLTDRNGDIKVNTISDFMNDFIRNFWG